MTWLNKLAMIILFFISFIIGVIFFKTAKAAEPAAQAAPQGASKTEYKSGDSRDPFQEEEIEIEGQVQEQAQARPLPSLQIQGIVWGGSFPQAVINNKVVREGDTIEEAKITDINKSGVTIFFDNRQYTLSTSSPVSSQGPKKNP